MIFQRRSLNNISSYTLYRGTPVRETIPILSAIRLVSRRSDERGVLRVYAPHVHDVYTCGAPEENEISDTDPRNKPTVYYFSP